MHSTIIMPYKCDTLACMCQGHEMCPPAHGLAVYDASLTSLSLLALATAISNHLKSTRQTINKSTCAKGKVLKFKKKLRTANTNGFVLFFVWSVLESGVNKNTPLLRVQKHKSLNPITQCYIIIVGK